MEDNYNYYTSTHHSTALRTFYVALNRLGGPRVTYLPVNKPLGKLSTYVKSFTLIVPEHRSETLIARLFGANHVKHGIKHLCDSGKELKELNAHTMLRPECSTSNQKLVPATKKPTSHNHRNHNHNHNKRVPSTAPAPLIERKQQNIGRNNPNSCTSSDECPKKKKKNYGRNGTNGGRITGGSSSESPEARTKQKQTKGAKRVNKNSKKSIATTTTTMMPPTLPPSNGNRFQSMSPRRWPALDDTTTGGHFDDALSDSSSASIPILGNGHAALSNDDDDDIDYDDR